MASLDYRLNPIYTIKECSSCRDLYNKSCGCSKGGFVDKLVRDPNKTPDLSQQPLHNCLKCGNPVDGLYCRQCALLRKKLKEDTDENSSQSPPHIDHHCCYGCGDSLDGLTIAITPVLSIDDPVDSLIIEDEHLDTILAMESDEVIKSSVEDLVPIPSESEGIPENMCDVPFRDNSLPLNISKDQFEDFSDSNDDSTLIDDDYFSIDDIDYVEASPPDSELVSLKEVKVDILREKLLKIHFLIAKIEYLNENPTPDCVLKSPSPFPILVEDTSLSYSDNCLPEFKTFSDHMEEMSCGSTTTHADNSLTEYDSFLFEIKPDHRELTSVVMEDNLG
nr:hypothetical protein [Tanacetum cinerariifolium]